MRLSTNLFVPALLLMWCVVAVADQAVTEPQSTDLLKIDMSATASDALDDVESGSWLTPARSNLLDAFAQGSRVAMFSASGALSGNDGEVYQGHMGLGYYFLDGHAVNIEIALGGMDGDSGAGDGINAAIEFLLRSHWIRVDDWSLFIEGGVGVIWLEEQFPDGGTRWNFTPQAGLGMTYRLDDTKHLIAGGRWYHISNADTNGIDRNPAYNGVMFYAGLLFEF